MKKKEQPKFSRLNQPMMATKVLKADGRVLEFSENGQVNKVTTPHADGQKPDSNAQAKAKFERESKVDE